MQRLRDRVSELRDRSPGDVSINVLSLRNGVSINSLEAYVNIADQKAQIRTEWPSHAPRFFLFRIAKLRSLALRALALVFKDQRHVNQATISALRESVSLNRHLIEQIEILRAEIESIKRSIRSNASS
jgi:O-antigen chain-terminating methyltransferase